MVPKENTLDKEIRAGEKAFSLQANNSFPQ